MKVMFGLKQKRSKGKSKTGQKVLGGSMKIGKWKKRHSHCLTKNPHAASAFVKLNKGGVNQNG